MRCDAGNDVKSLVIGYGNDLRSDDGAGRVAAERITDLDLTGVTIRSLSQLTPELALEIVEADVVIFVDASVEVTETTVVPVSPRPMAGSAVTHFAEPGALLGMAETVGSVPRRVFLVSIPVTDLDLGFELSPVATNGVDQAVILVTDLIGE